MNICPICGSNNLRRNYLKFNYGHKDYVLVMCLDCSGLSYENEFFFDFKENLDHNRSLKTYLEKTSDIETMVEVMTNFFNHFAGDTHTGIDIGCGVGMVMDFSEKVMAKEMIGFEPSSHYCKEGRDTLGLTIIEDFFTPEKINYKQFDFAVCFQLLQLVPEPGMLLTDIRKSLTNNGILLLSTPDNEVILPEVNFANHLSTLSPGVHRSIFNEKSLKHIILKTGFKNVQIHNRSGQIFAIASDRTLPVFDIFEPNRNLLLNYYTRKLDELPGDSSYFRGIWYRLYRNRIDHGEYEKALDLLKNAEWFEMWSETEVESIRTPDKLYELNSSADAIILYYTGILFLNYLKKNEWAEKFFLLSFLLCQRIIQIHPDMCPIEKDIVWLAKLHHVLAISYQNRIQEAKNELILIVSKNITIADNLHEPPPDVISKAENMLKLFD